MGEIDFILDSTDEDGDRIMRQAMQANGFTVESMKQYIKENKAEFEDYTDEQIQLMINELKRIEES